MNEKDQEELLKVEIYSLAYIYYCIDEKKKTIDESYILISEIFKRKNACSNKLSKVNDCFHLNLDPDEKKLFQDREIELKKKLVIYDHFLTKLDFYVDSFKKDILYNENELEWLINNLVAVKGKDLVLDKNNVYGYYEIMHNGLASNWIELVNTYETKQYRGEVIRSLHQISNSLNQIEYQLEGISNILSSINNSISKLVNSVDKIKNDIGEMKLNLSDHLSNIYNEVKDIKPYLIPKPQNETNNDSAKAKTNIDHSMCLLCAKNKICYQQQCTGFYPKTMR